MFVLLLTLLGQSPAEFTPSQPPLPRGGSQVILTPQWKQGQEFLYRGSVKEEDLTQASSLINEYKLEVRALVLSINDGTAEVAFSTKLTHGNTDRAQESSIDLTVAMIDRSGKITSTTHPHGIILPTERPATWEHGWVLNVSSPEVTSRTTWEIAQVGRLPCHYKVRSISDAEIIIQGDQHSFDWESPRGDSTAWKRSETLTFDGKTSYPQKVIRLIERRAPAHQRITSRLVTEYELVSTQVLDGPNLAAYQRDILQIRTFQQQLQALASTLGTSPARQEFERLGTELERFQATSGTTPYREALSSLQALVRAGIENRLANLRITQEARSRENEMLADVKLETIDGKSTVMISQWRGQACLLVFVRPGTSLTRTVTAWTDTLQRKLGKVGFVCLFLFTTDDEKVVQASFIESAPKDHLLRGQQLTTAMSVTETPHFIVLDVDGGVAGRFTGWGSEPCRDLEKLLRTEAAKSRK
jgi:hypothetical protein